MSEDAGIEPRTIATSALAVRLDLIHFSMKWNCLRQCGRVADPDPRYFGKLDPDPHNSEKFRSIGSKWSHGKASEHSQRRREAQNGTQEGLLTSGCRFASLWWGAGSSSGSTLKWKTRSESAVRWKDGSGFALVMRIRNSEMWRRFFIEKDSIEFSPFWIKWFSPLIADIFITIQISNDRPNLSNIR